MPAVTAVTLYFLYLFSGADPACCVHGTTALLAGEKLIKWHVAGAITIGRTY